ncbi:dihydroorotase [Clostridiaceae bacterium DONG20-135]|uniref:Dihydroorotase n=1 Tax=Copranaerobaculum intestinale TaxID=2692629 RepID=A0A6N8U5T0_9FIRM|nr:dihydroorotase [Copranaerobaculum intestinale]MXQ72865.1 dihydroorotase [Copranaerobaculum intestinale]
MILIKDGRVIDPLSHTDEVLDIIIDGERIAHIGKYQRSEEFDSIIEARGCIVAPGFVDVHVHFRDPGFPEKETIESGARAAAHGGFTSVVCMANTKPPLDSAEALTYVIEQAKKASIHVYSVAALTKGMQGKELVDMEALVKAGAVGFSDDGLPIRNGKLCREAMIKAKALGVPISFHEEDPDYITGNGVNQGAVSKSLGIGGAPNVAEDVMVARDTMLALDTQAPISIQHISSGNSVALVRLAKSLGAPIVAEATPHHFTLCEDAVQKYGSLAKMNPPLRTTADRYHIIEGLKDDTIEIIATDHAPHTSDEKAKGLAASPSGIIGLETSLALGITSLVRKGSLTISRLIEKMSLKPAAFYHMDAGYLKESGPADIVIFNEQELWTPECFASKSKNSPFLGMPLYGRVHYTICAGKLVYQLHEE